MDKHTESLKVLASGAIISLFFGAVGYGLMFAFKVFAARFFGPEKFGLFEMGNTLLGIGAIVSLFGIHAGVSRYIAVYEERREFDKLKGYISFIFRLPVIMSLAVSVIVFLVAPIINDFFNFESVFITIIRIIALIIPLRVINEIVYQIFYAKNKVLIQNIGNNIIEKTVLLMGIFLVYFYNLDIVFVIWILLISILVAFVFNLLYLKLKISFGKSKEQTNDYAGWLAFSVPLFFANIFAFFINWTDNIVIGKILTSSDLGIYAVSFSLAAFLLFFQTSFVSIFVPVMSRLYAKGNKEGFSHIYKKAQNWVFSMALPLALIFMFFSKELIEILYGKAFLAASLPLIILSIGILFNVYTGMNASLLKVIKNTKFLFKTKVVMASINVVLSIILIQKMGILGVAISTAIVIAGEQFVYMIKVRKYFNINHNNFINFKLIVVGVALICVAKYLVNIWGIAFSPGTFIAVILIYLVCYVVVAILNGAIDKNDYLIFKNLIFNGRQ